MDVEHKSGLAQELRKEREEGRGLGRGDDDSKAGDEIILSTSMTYNVDGMIVQRFQQT